MRYHGMEVDAAMRLAGMQVQGDREDGQLGGDQQVDGERNPAGLQQAAGEELWNRNRHWNSGGMIAGQASSLPQHHHASTGRPPLTGRRGCSALLAFSRWVQSAEMSASSRSRNAAYTGSVSVLTPCQRSEERRVG